MKRNNSLDALRGIAILLMVLSGSISFGILPGWMYHAQVPPPNHVFNPNLAGITWVDLVFPFFLFSMGAAIPLSMHKKIMYNKPYRVVYDVVKRFLLLAFFAVFTFYARAWVLDKTPGIKEYILSIICFVLLFVIYTDYNSKINENAERLTKLIGMLLAVIALCLGINDISTFTLYQSDIIIMVLANMALFGMLLWWLTSKNVRIRLGILPFVAAIFLASGEKESINKLIFDFTPFPWLYKFYYLKYLFIIIPATLAGEWILADQENSDVEPLSVKQYFLIAVTGVCLILTNIVGLYLRALGTNLFLSVLLIIILLYLVNSLKGVKYQNLLSKFIYAGVYLLLLGLFFEAYEGGIKKDFSTYSYYFVCTGLAFIALSVLTIIEKNTIISPAFKLVTLTGKNPMIAYTAGNLLLIPLLHLTGAITWLNAIGTGHFGGFMRGVLFTSVVAFITITATRYRIFWKT